MRCTPHLGARLVGHVVGSCIMVAPAYASDTSGLDFQQFVDDVGRNRDFFISVATAAKSTFTFGQLVDAVKSADEAKRSADEAKRSADEVFKASPEGKIQGAGNNMRPSLVVAASQASRWQQKRPCEGREVLRDSPSKVPIGKRRCTRNLK